MSDLFAVRVLEVSPQAAVLRVTSVHPDSGPVAPRAVFALMLLNDPLAKSGDAEFSKYSHVGDSALGQAVDPDSFFNSEWLKANAQAFVKKVMLSGSKLEIQPTHPAWIAHLRKGMAWHTTAYDAGPGLPAAPRAPAPKRRPGQRSQDPAAGFRVGRPHAPDFKIPGAFIPLHGLTEYVADPVITDPVAMSKAAETMIGQPLLVVPKHEQKRIGTLVVRTPDQLLLYLEAADWHGSVLYNFNDLKSLGRAWLAKDDAATASGPTAKSQGRGAKKAAVKKAASTARAKKTAKRRG